MSENTYALSSALADLRTQLLAAQAEGEGKALKFEITEIDLELKVAATDAVEAGMKVGWQIFGASASAKAEDSLVHTLRLTMQLKGPGGKPTTISGEGSSPAK